MAIVRSDLQPDPTVDSRLIELRSRFRAVLPERLATIRQRLAALGPGEWPGTATEELRGEVHALAGSAGLFGYDGVGAAAQDILARVNQNDA